MVYSSFSLVIYFIHSSVHMSISISQFIPSPPPWFPYICSLHLSLYFCFAKKFICIIFLDSTCYWYYMIFCFSLSDFTLCKCLCVSTSINVSPMAQFCSFLWLNILHCIYVPHLLYPFLCWWTFKLLLCPGYCKYWCNEHWGASIFFELCFS